MSEIRLNIGAGNTEIPGFTPLDAKRGHDVRRLDYPDNSVEEIRASHILEHFGHQEVAKVLHEWVRVLRPGGRIRLAVPNFEWIARNYLDGKNFNVQGYLMGGQVDSDDYHKCAFDEEMLREAMAQVGLVEIQPWQSPNTDCASLEVSLNLEGRKASATGGTIGRDVVACMSLPRLAFTDNMFCVLGACAPLKIRVIKGSGVFWGQVLTRMFETAIADGAKYVLAIDYDTVFTRQDVERLYATMEAHPEVDALVPVQMRRESIHALLTKRGDDGNMLTSLPTSVFRDELMEINTGHFGLTLLRCSKFAALPRPWFIHHPGPDGRWDDGKVDEDCVFWEQWRSAGNTLYSANRIAIGHMQLVVTWPDKTVKPLHQAVVDYTGHGKPEGTL